MNEGLTQIIKIATLGTTRSSSPIQVPAISRYLEQIQASEEDQEDGFLKSSALIFAWTEAGFTGNNISSFIEVCPAEEQPIAGNSLSDLLEMLIQSQQWQDVNFILFHIDQQNKVVPGELAIYLLSALSSKMLHTERAKRLTGKRGIWLASLNPDWSTIEEVELSENTWLEGAAGERKAYFARLRKTSPEQSRMLLVDHFSSENAEMRTAMVESLEMNLAPEDEGFLLSCTTDRSIKVKQAAYRLLSLLPGSDLGQACIRYLSGSIHIETSRVMLITTKKTLVIRETQPPAQILIDAGLDLTSNKSQISDEAFRVGQILGLVNPQVLAKKLGCAEDELFLLFTQHPAISYFAPFLAEAAIRFQNKTLAITLMDQNLSNQHEELLKILSPQERRAIMVRLLKVLPLPALIHHAMDEEYAEFDHGFATLLIGHLAESPYGVQDGEYRKMGYYFPTSTLPVIKKFQDKSENKYFTQKAQTLLDTMALKQEILTLAQQ